MNPHKISLSLLGAFLILMTSLIGSVSEAMVIEGGLDYPVAIGSLGQSLNPNPGFTGSLYFNPILSDSINNFLSMSYASFTVKADGKTSYRVIPILVGLELPGKVSDSVRTTFSAAVGGSLAYLNVINSASTNMNAYLTAQVKGGVDIDLSSNISFYARTPITFVISSNSLSFVSYSLGLGFKI